MVFVMKRLSVLIFALLSTMTYASPLIIAHRGASGLLPEHTLEAYQLAIEQGADYIEPDLVVTSDGVLIARHDVYLSTTTNVADVFPERKRKIDGRTDWFVHDFTLAEIRQLRARQPFAERSQVHNDRYLVPTFEEVLNLLAKTERPLGIYPEIKAPALFLAMGLDSGQLLLAALAAREVKDSVFIQSFDAESLRRLRPYTTLPLVMLLTPRSRVSLAPNVPLEEVAMFADGIGVMKQMLLTPGGSTSSLLVSARSHGLFVHAWTFRDDRLPREFASGAEEIAHYLNLGVDGVFTDFPDTGVKARRSWQQTR